MSMEWNVFLYDGCRDKAMPRKFNIFDNRSFARAIKDIFDEPELSHDEFEELVRHAAQWQFWSRCEYEFILLSWPTGPNEKGYKMDVYEQLEVNWFRFIEYVWNCYCFREYEDEEEEEDEE